MITIPEPKILRQRSKRRALLRVVRLYHERRIAGRGAVLLALALDETAHGRRVVFAWLPFLVDLVAYAAEVVVGVGEGDFGFVGAVADFEGFVVDGPGGGG